MKKIRAIYETVTLISCSFTQLLVSLSQQTFRRRDVRLALSGTGNTNLPFLMLYFGGFAFNLSLSQDVKQCKCHSTIFYFIPLSSQSNFTSASLEYLLLHTGQGSPNHVLMQSFTN